MLLRHEWHFKNTYVVWIQLAMYVYVQEYVVKEAIANERG